MSGQEKSAAFGSHDTEVCCRSRGDDVDENEDKDDGGGLPARSLPS